MNIIVRRLVGQRDQIKIFSQENGIDSMQKWLPLNYSFARIQNSFTNFVRDNKFFTIFVSKTTLVRLI